MTTPKADARDIESWAQLPLATAQEIESLCTRFESEARTGTAAIAALLVGSVGPTRLALLQELVWLDMELRQQAGETPQRSDYSDFATEADRIAAQKAFSEYGKTDETSIDVARSGQIFELGSQNANSNAGSGWRRYKFIREVGKGGLGVVYRVFDRETNRHLAIKCLRDSYRNSELAAQRLMREAILTGILQHPSVPPVYDRGVLPNGVAYFSMKLVEGETFESMLAGRKSKENELSRCLDIFDQVAQTIAYAHSKSIIHRDLKPQNIMVGQFGEVQVLDWGLAKQLDAEQTEKTSELVAEAMQACLVPLSNNRASHETASPDETPATSDMTKFGDIVGTPSSMSPEQARGDVEHVDTRTDVFGLGTILFEILTQRRLFDGYSSEEALRHAAAGDYANALETLEQVGSPQELVQLCKSCLSANPVDRPNSAEEVARVTTAYLSSLNLRLQEAEIEVVRQAESRRRQKQFGWMAMALAVASCLGLAVVTWKWLEADQAKRAETRARLAALSEAATTSEVSQFLAEILASARPEREGRDVTVREVMDAMLPELDRSFVDKPNVEGLIRRTFATTYRGLGDYHVAIQQMKLAVAAFERVTPIDELELLYTQDRLAGILRSQRGPGNLEQAYELRSHVLKRRIELLGETHPDSIDSLNNLGLVLAEQDRFAEAKIYLRRSLALERTLPQQDPVSLAKTEYNLATIAWQEGELKEAIDVMTGMVESYEDEPSASDLYHQLHHVLGQIYKDAGKLTEARQAFEQGLSERQAYLGPGHPDTLSTMRKLTRLLVENQDYSTALDLLLQGVIQHNETYGQAAGLTFSVREYIPRALEGLGRLQEAEEYLRETVQLLEDNRGLTHAYTDQAKEQLEEFLTRQPSAHNSSGSSTGS